MSDNVHMIVDNSELERKLTERIRHLLGELTVTLEEANRSGIDFQFNIPGPDPVTHRRMYTLAIVRKLV